MIRMHAAPSPASSPAEKWPNDEKAETRAPGNEKAPNRCPGLFRIPDRPSTGEMGGRLLVQRGRRQLVPIVEGVRSGARHGCGYALANAGHDTRALQAWLGHTRTSSTRFGTQSFHPPAITGRMRC